MVTPYDEVGAHGERVPTNLTKRPGMRQFADHILTEHGGQSLGIYGNRNIRGGNSKSVHAVARAFDWSYPNRPEAEKVMNALTANDGSLAAVFGVQAIHDYAVTHPQHRDLGHTWGHGRGWHYGHIGSAGGRWLHIELDISAAEDPELMDRLGKLFSPQPQEHPTVADADDSRRHPHATQQLGSHNPEVAMLQGILADWHRQRPDLVPTSVGAIDGRFGERTAQCLREFQFSVLGVPADGVYGPISADKLAQVTRYLEAAAGR